LVNNPLNTEDSQSFDLEVQIQPISTPDELYWETDDVNPNQVIYDLENNEVMILEEDEYTTPTPTDQPIIKKIVSRNVGNSRRRRFR
jgi:hypothetical protein